MTEPRAHTPPPELPASPEEAAEVRAGDQKPSSRERTCIGCGEHAPPGEMVRLVLGPSGEVAVDAAGGGFGRGAHVHARGACLAHAAGRGLARATKGQARAVSLAIKEGGEVMSSEPAPLSAEALVQAVEAAMERRIAGLLAAAVRARKARVGSDAVTGVWREGDAELVVVATDAAAAADLSAVREAISAGAAVAWGTKLTLAAAVQRQPTQEGVAVVAITDAGIAGAVRDAVHKAMGARDAGTPPPRAARRSPPKAKARQRDVQKPSPAGVQKSSPAVTGKSAPDGVRQSLPKDVRQSLPRDAKRSRNPDKDAAPRGGFRGKVEPERAGRASGRHLRRAQESRQ